MTVRTRTVRTRLVGPGQFVPRTDSPPDTWYPATWSPCEVLLAKTYLSYSDLIVEAANLHDYLIGFKYALYAMASFYLLSIRMLLNE